METNVLDGFPHWPVYIAAYVALAVFGFGLVAFIWVCGVHVLAAFYAPRVPYKRLPGYFSTAFFTVCASVAFWLIFSMMFVRFSGVAIAKDHIELQYFWPRPNMSIPDTNIESASIYYYHDKGCRLEIFTHRRHYRSVDLDGVKAAEHIKDTVDAMATK